MRQTLLTGLRFIPNPSLQGWYTGVLQPNHHAEAPDGKGSCCERVTIDRNAIACNATTSPTKGSRRNQVNRAGFSLAQSGKIR
jgi:hypothetical protein